MSDQPIPAREQEPSPRSPYDITPNMVALVSSVRDKFQSQYAREDLEAVYAELMRQKRQKTTGYAFRKRELVWMLQCCGQTCTEETPEETLRAQIARMPSRRKIEANLFAELYRIYASFPKSSLYMERLVRRLGDPDFRTDSVRMAILKQFIRHTGFHTTAIVKYVIAQNQALFDAMCAAAPEKGGAAVPPSRQAATDFVLAHLREDIFDLLHQTDVRLSELDTTRISLRSLLCSGALQETQIDGLAPADAAGRRLSEVLRELLDRIEADALSGQEQADAVQLVAAVRRRADALGPEIQKALRASDAQKKKDALRQKRRAESWQLLKLCDDLAAGRFRTNGRTRTDLYLFAIAFGMTVNTGAPGSYQPETDLEKNLFHDFYTDNLLRYLSEEYAQNSGDYEAEPSGEGINFKNFAEVIYLYYLAQPGLTAQQKIKRANLMINKCFAAAAETARPAAAETPFYTRAYRELFLDTICSLPESALQACILQNFRIDTDVRSKGRTASASEAVAARRAYEEITAELMEYQPSHAMEGIRYSREQQSDGSRYTVTGGVINYGLDIDLTQADAAIPQDADFRKVLQNMNRMLRIQLPDSGQSKVTRTKLIAAYYYLYLMRDSGEEMSLPELCADFCAQLDPILEQARYQKISEKNLFDVFVLISLYRLENLV